MIIMRIARHRLLASTLLATLVGCGGERTDIVVDKPQSDAALRYSDVSWATVLRENVTDGLVRYDHLAEHAEPLDTYLAILADTGPETTPETFPTREDKLCYYINAYNAFMLQAVLVSDVPGSMHNTDLGNPDHRFRTMIDGQRRTLDDIRKLAMQHAEGDARVYLTLCDAALGSPPIQSTPLRSTGLEEQLRKTAQRAMDNHALVTIDHVEQWLLVGSAILDHAEAFVNQYQKRTNAGSASLHDVVVHQAGAVRRQWLNTAVGYSVHRIPFDRRLNHWGRANQSE